MALLFFSQCVGKPVKIDIDKGTAEQRTLDIVCTVSPAGAITGMDVSIQDADFESPILGSQLPHQQLTVPGNGEIVQKVTLKSTGGAKPTATIAVVLTEVPATPGALVAPPQRLTAVITIRT